MASRRPASADTGNNIRVVCRFRPQNAREIKEGGVNCVKIHEDGQTVSLEVCLFLLLNEYLIYTFKNNY